MPTETLMKKSKFDILGYYPNTWEEKRLKYLCSINTGNKDTVDAIDDGIYPFYVRSPKVERINSYSFDGEAILMAGDGVGAGKIFHYVNEKFDYHQRVYNMHNFKYINGKYLFYYLRELFSIEIEKGSAKSTVDSIRLPMLQNFIIPIPDINEQQTIADFLDEKCEKIDKVIGEIEEQIQVLEDYKKSLITETVTKGLDKNVSMKDSGIDWIGQIPQDWDIKRLKYIGNARNGLTYEPEDMVDEDGILVLRSSNIQDNKLSFDDNVYVKMLIPKQLIVKENDLLICSRNGSRNLIGKCALIDKNTAGNSYGAFMCVFRSEYNRFIRYVLLSDIFNYYLSNFLTATINQLTNMQLGNIKAPIPPINVMKCIADYLDKECAKIDKTISDKKEQLETIKEYKKSLIYEYVTGKKRVAC